MRNHLKDSNSDKIKVISTRLDLYLEYTREIEKLLLHGFSNTDLKDKVVDDLQLLDLAYKRQDIFDLFLLDYCRANQLF